MLRLKLLPLRYLPYATSMLGLLATLPLAWLEPAWSPVPAVFGALTILGTRDLIQRKHTVSRNYPILAHFRYFLESIGPEIRQYFIESDTEAMPFSREQRSIVYRRAKNVLDKKPFGSLHDMYAPGYEWLNHSLQPAHIDNQDFRITVGGERGQPYSVSVFNISAMSFGSLSPNAILALNAGARIGGFYHDTGEGGISRHHRKHGGDLVWEIGSGYFGCRNPDGSFNAEAFERSARMEQVRMIEIKLSQGAKPGHGGVLPAAKVSREIAEARGVPEGEDVISPPAHSAFNTPLELMAFIERLRFLSGEKPVGIKLAIGHPWEWFAIVKAMLESGTHPDFIVVDGGEGGTGAAPLEHINRIGEPLSEGLLLVHNTLVGTNLRDRICIGAAGKITSAFHIARSLALGADWCNAARGFMFSLGCIQAQSCHTDRCPSGVATQDPSRGAKLDVPSKSERVYNFHRNTVGALANMLTTAGLTHPEQFGPEHIIRRMSANDVRSYRELYHFIDHGSLLEGPGPEHSLFQRYWKSATPESFAPPNFIMSLREAKVH